MALLEKEQKVGEQTAGLERDAQIKEAQRQQAVRIAQLDKEQKVGEQNAVLEREAQIKDAERKMRIAVADANAVTIDDYVADVEAWIGVIRKQTGLPCVWLLGHSEGGLVTLRQLVLHAIR